MAAKKNKQNTRRAKPPVAHRALKAGHIEIVTRGEAHDLRDILKEVVRDHGDIFPKRFLRICITWENPLPKHADGRQRPHQKIDLGGYHFEGNFIVMHRTLDRAWVPRFYVAAIVLHELLHAKIPPIQVNGRWLFHTPQLKRIEQTSAYYYKAKAWEKRNLWRLFRY